MKKIIRLFWHLLLFPILSIPYSILNSKVLVNVFGCGCPRVEVDENGNVINEVTDYFSANDFTSIFWSVIFIIFAVITVFSSKLIKNKLLKALYIAAMLLLGFFIAYFMVQTSMWN